MRRIDLAPLLAACGALLLLVSLFLHWYQPHMSAWTAFEVWDLVLAALALGAIWVAVANAAWQAPLREGVLPLLGGAALVIVVSQLVNHPPAAQGAALQSGAWLALGGSALMAAGAALTVVDVSLSLAVSAPERPPRSPAPASEAAAVEPEVQDELYPVEERSGPIGADDPEPWRDPAEDETIPFDHERDEPS